jgi:hypothetical protein
MEKTDGRKKQDVDWTLTLTWRDLTSIHKNKATSSISIPYRALIGKDCLIMKSVNIYTTQMSRKYSSIRTDKQYLLFSLTIPFPSNIYLLQLQLQVRSMYWYKFTLGFGLGKKRNINQSNLTSVDVCRIIYTQPGQRVERGEANAQSPLHLHCIIPLLFF